MMGDNRGMLYPQQPSRESKKPSRIRTVIRKYVVPILLLALLFSVVFGVALALDHFFFSSEMTVPTPTPSGTGTGTTNPYMTVKHDNDTILSGTNQSGIWEWDATAKAFKTNITITNAHNKNIDLYFTSTIIGSDWTFSVPAGDQMGLAPSATRSFLLQVAKTTPVAGEHVQITVDIEPRESGTS